jgi:DNA-binding CsgD family transcriptional regulator
MAGGRGDLGELVDTVQRIPEHFESIAPRLADGLLPLLGCEVAGIYRPKRSDRGWELDLFAGSGNLPPQSREVMAAFLSRAPVTFAPYDAERPKPQERNRVVLIDPAHRSPEDSRTPIVRELMPRLGVAKASQLRVLVCDGPALLGWVGAWRHGPFEPAHAEVLRALTKPLRTRLKLERQLSAGQQHRAALFAALDRMDVAAFLLAGDRIEHMNPAGRSRLEREGASTRAAIARLREAPSAVSFSVQASGLPALKLVLLRPSDRDGEGKLRELAIAWKLSRRQIDVLRLLSTGETNKGIASKLGCAEVTVEFHLSVLFRKTGTENRGELISRFWRA